MKTSRLILSAVSFLTLALSGWASSTSMVVTADRVNVRAKPSVQAEVVGQLATGQKIEVRSTTNDWACIAPTTNLTAWICRDFVKDGAVTVSKLKMRAGPGFAFSEVGMIEKGEQVTVKSEHGEWLGVEPAEGCAFWVNLKLLRPVPSAVEPAGAEVPAVVPAPAPAPQAGAPAQVPTKAPPAVLASQGLVPLEGQGHVVKVEGELRSAGFLFGAPGRYRLVEKKDGVYRTVCYVRGNNAQLSALKGRRMLVTGREYWLEGARDPIVVPEQIVLR